MLLAPWKDSHDLASFAQLRLAQANLSAHVSKTFTVSTLDGGAKTGAVHSPYKQAPGRRAALGLAAGADPAAPQQFLTPAYASSVARGTTVTVTIGPAGLCV